MEESGGRKWTQLSLNNKKCKKIIKIKERKGKLKELSVPAKTNKTKPNSYYYKEAQALYQHIQRLEKQNAIHTNGVYK